MNGYLGVDFNAAAALPPASLRAVATALLARGVTTFLPTLITNAPAALAANLAALAAAAEGDPLLRAVAPGFHVEGPFISPLPGYRGAHDAAHCALPTLAAFDALQLAARGRVRVLTLAPELPGALALISALSARGGVAVALGHTAASGAEVAAAAAAGATLSTHLGNGLPAVLARHPNPIWEQLACDGLRACLIADGQHVPEALLRVALRAKGEGRVVLVSDAAPLAGCAPGAYTTFVGGAVVLEPGGERLRLAADPTLLAGSTLTLDRAVARVAPLLLPLRAGAEARRRALFAAWRMASDAPREAAGLPRAGLGLGEPADAVAFEAAWEEGGASCAIRICHVWKGGVRVAGGAA